MEKVTSTEIKKALAGYHYKDYFITECKTCSTYFPDPQGMLKFDGIAIRKSYTGPCITGYEIKVSRGDFLQDNKWHLYLQYCNEFYFVVPNGLIDKTELPENVGLIYYYPETGCLKKKKKALYRNIEEPVGVYKYIIFSRLDQDRLPFYEERAKYAEDYLEDKNAKRRLGKRFGSKMANDLIEAQEKLEKLGNVEENLAEYEEIMKVLYKHRISWSMRYHDGDLIKNLENAISSTYPKELDLVERKLQYAMDELRNIRDKYENKEANNE